MSMEEQSRDELWDGQEPDVSDDKEPTADELQELETELPRDFTGLEEELDPANPLRMYMKEVGSIPRIETEEERRLAGIVQTGRRAEDQLERAMWESEPMDPEEQERLEKLVAAGDRAKKRLTEANLRLVIYAVKGYIGKGMSLQDLIQEGNVGLMKAAERYDPDRGCRFSTYAMYWIRQAAGRAQAEQGDVIRVPVHMVENIRKVNVASRRLLQELGREPSEDEIAARLKVTVDWVRKVKRYDRNTVSLEKPVGEDEGDTIGDFIPDDEGAEPVRAAEESELRQRLEEVLATLPPMEEQVIRMRFGFGCDAYRLDEVAEQLGISRERAKQIENRALRMLYRPERKKKLKEFLN